MLTEHEVSEIEKVFEQFLGREIHVPGKDFCDMSKPFGIPFEDWSIVNCMLPTRYYPPFQNNIFERITSKIVKQLHPHLEMVKDYDQLLNKRPGKSDAVFAWHQDMGYWPSPEILGVNETDTCTCSLAIDDSTEENGCLRYVPGSQILRTLRQHTPLSGSRDDGHALKLEVDESIGDVIKLAPCTRGSITVHDEWVVHGSSGNMCKDRQRRTCKFAVFYLIECHCCHELSSHYGTNCADVLAYRPRNVVEAERRLGFTHSHNDNVNWDTFGDSLDRKKESF